VLLTPDVIAAGTNQATLNPGEIENALRPAFQEAQSYVYALPESGLGGPRRGSSIPTLERSVPSLSLAADAAATGIADFAEGEIDAAGRTMPLVAELVATDGSRSVVPSTALVALLRAEGLAPRLIERRAGIEVDGRFVPTENDHRLRVNYSADLLPGGDGVIAGRDFVDGGHDVEGKTVFVGATDSRYTDHVRAPMGADGQLPSVIVQANALNTMLTERFLTPASDAGTVATTLLLALLAALAMLLLPVWASLPLTALAGYGYWRYAEYQFEQGHLVDVLYPLVGLVVGYLAAGAWRAIQEYRARHRVSQMFSRYVPDAVARQLLEPGQADVAAAGQRLEVAVLFCDLRGFTALSSTMEPAELRDLLDRYYERASRIVFARGGTVLRFVGDEVFAVFGAPLPQQDHAAVALQCAQELLLEHDDLCAELAADGLPAIEYGIGVHVGPVIAADVGSSAHRQYDVLGDAVNIGARLCSYAREGEIVFSAQVRDAVDAGLEAEALGVLDLKGVGGRISGFRIRRERPATERVSAP
jgi:class 3 adenylate cyclase